MAINKFKISFYKLQSRFIGGGGGLQNSTKMKSVDAYPYPQLSVNDVKQAAKRLEEAKAHMTPIASCSAIDALASIRIGEGASLERQLFFKCENFQKVPAMNSLSALIKNPLPQHSLLLGRRIQVQRRVQRCIQAL